MTDKSYRDMTDDELREAMAEWGCNVENAYGFSSAYFAAKQCAVIEKEAKRRNETRLKRSSYVDIENRWPIT